MKSLMTILKSKMEYWHFAVVLRGLEYFPGPENVCYVFVVAVLCISYAMNHVRVLNPNQP